jgi:hypothetical protein
MGETGKQIWLIISAIIALVFAGGFAQVIYYGLAALPFGLDLSYNLFYAALTAIVVFSVVLTVLFRGIHPY